MIVPQVIKREYASGFKAEVALRPGFNENFFGIMVDFGSADPQGVAGSAHFLEHKLFTKKSGDLAHEFEALGADCNAFTSSNETMFYCQGSTHTPKLIELLFKLVGEPYFTTANVKHEVPIIQQELAMYQDDPQWWVNDALKRQLYGNSLLGLDVAGTQTSISQITAAQLAQVYASQYVAGQLNFIAAGDFSKNQIQTIFRQVTKLAERYFKAGRLAPRPEQPTGHLRHQTLTNRGSNYFGLAIRLPHFAPFQGSRDLAQTLLEFMLDAEFGPLSAWYQHQQSRQLLNSGLQLTMEYARQGNCLLLTGVSQQPDEVLAAIKAQLAQPLANVLGPAQFELQKKASFAHTVRSYNDLSLWAIELAEAALDGDDPYDLATKLEVLGFSEYQAACEQLMQGAKVGSAALGGSD